MIVQRLMGERGRDVSKANIGTTITNPNINYAQMAKVYGMYSEGPIEQPEGPGRRLSARARQGARGRAGAHRRRVAAAVT